MNDFRNRRLQQELAKLSTDALKLATNDGLAELMELVTKKPKGWTNEIGPIGDTLRLIRNELVKRGES